MLSTVMNLFRRDPADQAALDPAAASSMVVVDVRSPAEFASGHVEGAVNLPLERFAQQLPSLLPDKSTPVMLCCLSGARSGMACNWMREHGYANVTNGGSVRTVASRLQRNLQRG